MVWYYLCKNIWLIRQEINTSPSDDDCQTGNLAASRKQTLTYQCLQCLHVLLYLVTLGKDLHLDTINRLLPNATMLINLSNTKLLSITDMCDLCIGNFAYAKIHLQLIFLHACMQDTSSNESFMHCYLRILHNTSSNESFIHCCLMTPYIAHHLMIHSFHQPYIDDACILLSLPWVTRHKSRNILPIFTQSNFISLIPCFIFGHLPSSHDDYWVMGSIMSHINHEIRWLKPQIRSDTSAITYKSNGKLHVIIFSKRQRKSI